MTTIASARFWYDRLTQEANKFGSNPGSSARTKGQTAKHLNRFPHINTRRLGDDETQSNPEGLVLPEQASSDVGRHGARRMVRASSSRSIQSQ